MSESLQVSVIIPTKGRPKALAEVVSSLASQSVLPWELVIVDQSDNDEGRRRVDNALRAKLNGKAKSINVNYIHDPTIPGAATARNRALAAADGDVWLFLDDDVVLEPQFIEELLRTYQTDPQVAGVSGIITNYPRPPWPFFVWSTVFMRGPFADERQLIYWRAEGLRDSPPLDTQRFGCGLMSFRAGVMRGMSFDENLDAHLKGVSDGEDVDLCERLPSGTKLLIAPRARLAHYHNSAGRLSDHWLRRHSRGNFFLYEKHWKHGVTNRVAYAWLYTGYALAAMLGCARRLSLEPWRAFRIGQREARKASRAISED